MTEKGTEWVYQGVSSNLVAIVQGPISDWFYSRYLCTEDEDKFQRFFKRELNLAENRFLKLYDVQMQEINPLLTRQFKETVAGTSKNTGNEQTTGNDTYSGGVTTTKDETLARSGDTSRTTSGGDTSTTTNNLTEQTNSQGTSTNTETRDTQDTTTYNTTDTTTTDGYGRNLFSDTPQSNINASTTGNPDNITWEYATNLTDNIQNSTVTDKMTGDNEVAGTGTIKNDGSSTGQNTTTNSGTVTTETELNTTETTDVNLNDKTTGTTTVTDTRKKDSTGSVTRTDNNESNTSRTVEEQGDSAQNLFREYYSFLLDSNAWEWLLDRIDRCFLSTYELC